MDLGVKEIEQSIQDKLQKTKESDRVLANIARNGIAEKSVVTKIASDIILNTGLKYKDRIKKLPIVSKVAKRAYWRIIRNKYY